MTRVYVVDEQGATFAYADQGDADERYQFERTVGAVRLVMFAADAPDDIAHGDQYRLSDWCCSNAVPVEFIHGDRAAWLDDSE